MADNTGNDNSDLPDQTLWIQQSKVPPRHQPSHLDTPTRANTGFDLADYPFERRRNALAAIPTLHLSRGDWEETQRERNLAVAITNEVLSAARREVLSERDATMLAVKNRIEELEVEVKGMTDEQKIGAPEKEIKRLGGENEGMMRELEEQEKGKDGDSDDEKRVKLRLENQSMRAELQEMTE